MPISYTLSEDGRFMHTVATGVLTLQDEFDAWDYVCADSRVRQRVIELYDATQVTELAIDGDDLKEMFHYLHERPNLLATKLPLKTAVVSLEIRANALDQMWQSLADQMDHRMIYFASADRACRWLGVAPPEEQKMS